MIIQKDENGFGLTVSGDNPVFVQLVKEGEIQKEKREEKMQKNTERGDVAPATVVCPWR